MSTSLTSLAVIASWCATLLPSIGLASAAQVYVSETFEQGMPAGWSTRDLRGTTLQVAQRDDAQAGHCLSASGELKWIGVVHKLPKPIAVRPSVYVTADVRSQGRFGSVSLGVGSEGKLTHHKTGPAAYRPSTQWQRMVWCCDGYFPGRDDVWIDQIAFHQRVAGGYERPNGGARHSIQIDNVRVSAGDAARPAQALAEQLAGIRYYTGPQSFVVARLDGLTLWHAPSTAKVFQGQPIPERDATVVQIEAGRHEYESCQLVFSATERIDGLSLRLSALTGETGGRIPESELRWHPVCYLRIHSRVFGPPVDQLWPEPLSWNRAFGVVPGRNQPVWLTVHVPRQAAPGQYRGAVEIVRAGRRIGSVPLRLTVWDFELPSRPTFRTNQQLWIAAPSELDPRPRGVVQSDMVGLLAQYRMCDGHLFHRLSKPDQQQALGVWGQNTIKLPFCGGHGGGKGRKVTKLKGQYQIMTPEYEREFEALLTRWLAYYRERGCVDRAFLYLWDEPWGDFEVHDMILWLGRVSKRVAPDLKTLAAAPYHRKFESVVDIFLATYTEPELLRSARGRGVEFWWWGNSALAIDFAGIDARMRYGLESVQKGLTGAYSWGVAVWRGGDPWTTASRDNRASACLYPGGRPESEAPRVVPGITLELNRDGIEDYEYVAMLRRIKAPRARALVERCERFYCELSGARRDFSLVDGLRDLRRDVAQALTGPHPRPAGPVAGPRTQP